ncbi:SMI1/KNR4 family protein [Pseudomonas sp. F1_0610]|uniref:SMI1/KNR4 family protein n=1 Tax=Pseudomonas sp. F1_0610 TaxID=3114284 RepID=UPI0039C1B86C
MNQPYFSEEDLVDLWEYGYADEDPYHEAPPSDEYIAAIEQKLGGYKLPAAYIELMRKHNGGYLKRDCFVMSEDDEWEGFNLSLSGLYAVGEKARYSLLGEFGQNNAKAWGYPEVGVYFADTISGGHDLVAFDYRQCGKQGEPSIVHIDQESDYCITPIAPDFTHFIQGLVDSESLIDEEAEREAELATVERGTFSPIILKAMAKIQHETPNFPHYLRSLGKRIVQEKGHFSLHNDAQSWLMFDALFYLYSQLTTAQSIEHFLNEPKQFETRYDLPSFGLMIVFSIVDDTRYSFCTGGIGYGFLRDWWEKRLEEGSLEQSNQGYIFSIHKQQQLLKALTQL